MMQEKHSPENSTSGNSNEQGVFRRFYQQVGVPASFPTPGELRLKMKAKLAHGWRTAYWRDIQRPKILQTPPIETLDAGEIELHVLTSKGDWLNLIWSLKSFFHYNGTDYSIFLHEDGSLSPEAIQTLKTHFPGAHIIRRSVANEEIDNVLAPYPGCQKLRRENMLSLKVFDFKHYCRTDRFILFDSDLLFYKEVSTFLQKLRDSGYNLSTFNGDVSTAYTVDPVEVKERFGFQMPERINSGFAIIQSDVLNFGEIEEYLTLNGIFSHSWRIEQTIYAISASRHGVELLPDDQFGVYMEPGLGDRPMRHYVGRIRHLMYSEGMARLIKDGFLKKVGRS